MNLVQAMLDPQLFGAHPDFSGLKSWRAWTVFLRCCYGLPLTTDEDLATFRRHTGRSRYAPPEGGWREAVCVVGRQSGKSPVASLIAAYEAALAEGEKDKTQVYALLVAQDPRAALRTLYSYAVSYFDELPILAASVEDRKSQSLTLNNRVTLTAYPCRPEAVRGLRARVAVCDELAYFRSTDWRLTDTEMLRALRPTLATTGGRLIASRVPTLRRALCGISTAVTTARMILRYWCGRQAHPG